MKQLTFTARVLAVVVVWATMVLTSFGQSAPSANTVLNTNQNPQQNFTDIKHANEKSPKPAASPQSPKQIKIGKINFSGSLRLRIEDHSDTTDARHTTFFQVLPTPRIYARFPFYNMMNAEDVYAQFKLRPHPRISLRTDLHQLLLSSAKDLWYVGGGAFQESSFGYVGRPSGGRRGLGTVFDVSADFTITPTTTATVYAAAVRGSDVQSFTYPAGGSNPTARFLYAELTKRF